MIMTTTVLLLLLLAGSSVFVAAVLGVLGGTLASAFSTFPLIRGLGEMAWSSSADFILDQVAHIRLIDGVLNVSLVYQHAEPRQLLNEGVSHD